MAMIVIQSVLALFIGLGGIIKIIRVPFQVEHWSHYSYPLWFLTVVGVLELLSAIGLVAGFWNRTFAIGASLVIIFLMLGAMYTHLFKANHSFDMLIPSLICLIFSVIVIVRNMK
nr:DoxX family protein [Paenibacillus sp. L3-i20]